MGDWSISTTMCAYVATTNAYLAGKCGPDSDFPAFQNNEVTRKRHPTVQDIHCSTLKSKGKRDCPEGHEHGQSEANAKTGEAILASNDLQRMQTLGMWNAEWCRSKRSNYE